MALTEREELEMLELEEREKAFPAKPIVSEQPKEEDGVIESFGKGMIGREGEGVAHAIGGAVLPTAGAVIGSLAPGVGTVLGAAAGQTVKEAANAWMPGEPKDEHPLSPVGRVVMAGGLQKAGEAIPVGKGLEVVGKYASKIGDDAIGMFGKMSGISKEALDVIRKSPGGVFKKLFRVSNLDVEDSALKLQSKLIEQYRNGKVSELANAHVSDTLEDIVAPLLSSKSPEAMQRLSHLAKTDKDVFKLLNRLAPKELSDFMESSVALQASNLGPADAFSLGSAVGLLIHTPLATAALASRSPAAVAATQIAKSTVEKGVKKVAKIASKAVGEKTSAAASQALSQAAIEGIDGSVELDKDELNKRLEE